MVSSSFTLRGTALQNCWNLPRCAARRCWSNRVRGRVHCAATIITINYTQTFLLLDLELRDFKTFFDHLYFVVIVESKKFWQVIGYNFGKRMCFESFKTKLLQILALKHAKITRQKSFCFKVITQSGTPQRRYLDCFRARDAYDVMTIYFISYKIIPRDPQ